VAAAGLEDQIDVIVGTLGGALGSYGGFAACGSDLAEYLLYTSRTVRFSAAPAPPAAAAALAALTLLEERPEMVTKLTANAALLRGQLERRGFHLGYARSAILSLSVGDPAAAIDVAERALQRGVLTEPICPPVVPALESQLRLTVMVSHRREELLQAAEVVSDACEAAGIDPSSVVELEPEFEPQFEPQLDQAPSQIFDFEAVQRLAA
jgi:7-keto-8-aminopelargonate synthetase-like enzyme